MKTGRLEVFYFAWGKINLKIFNKCNELLRFSSHLRRDSDSRKKLPRCRQKLV